MVVGLECLDLSVSAFGCNRTQIFSMGVILFVNNMKNLSIYSEHGVAKIASDFTQIQ